MTGASAVVSPVNRVSQTDHRNVTFPPAARPTLAVMGRGLTDSPRVRAGKPEEGALEGRDSFEEARKHLGNRLGLNVPYEWWPRAASLKAIEAAGFGWIQVASPPVEMLADPRHVVRHGQTLRRSLNVTSLRPVAHGPVDLRLGSSRHNRAFEGLLEWAHQIGASKVVYHALDFPRLGPESEREERALKSLARWAETLDLVICLENLCPTYPGPASVSHDPEAVRKLVLRCDSPAARMLLDVGHANVVADREGSDLAALVEPVLDVVALFHVHDNLGARRRRRGELTERGGASFDPLRLDLHLPPGQGALPWDRVAKKLVEHAAPLMLEIHPSLRPRALTLFELTEATLLECTPLGPTPELFPRPVF
jgi:sugar phosphate isomerase/epimerase